MHNITTKFKLAAKQAAANVLADNKKKVLQFKPSNYKLTHVR